MGREKLRKSIKKNGKLIDFEFQILPQEVGHLHQNIELIYLLEGEADFTVEEEVYHIKPEDILVINSNKKHSYQSKGPILMAWFEIDYLQLCEMLGTNPLLFWCNSTINKNSAYEDLREIMKQIFELYYNKDTQGVLLLNSLFYQLLQTITEHFQAGNIYAQEVTKKSQSEERVVRIANYINANYRKRISLSELAKSLYVSVPYLSKYFKKQFGMTFSDYLNEIRMMHTIEDLLYTDMSIMNIALQNGFANTTVFNELFKKIHQITPSEYRKKMHSKRKTDQVDYVTKESQEKAKRIETYLDGNALEVPLVQHRENAVFQIEGNQRADYKKHWKQMINAGRAGDLLRSDVQEHILMLKEDLDFECMRIWDLFGPELMINENDEKGYYNFGKVDKIFDFLVEHNIRPYLEFGYKPKYIHRTLSKRIIKEEREIAFTSLASTRKFFFVFLQHLANRYGTEELENWYFEHWSGDDLENNSTNLVFYEIFEALYEAVKSISPHIPVGGGGVAIQFGNANLTALIEGWEKQKHRPDFLTLYCYPYIRGAIDEIAYAKISTDREYLKNQLEMANLSIKKSKLCGVELHISEWSSTISNRNLLNDSSYKGAYIVKNVLDSIGAVDVLGYWVGTDIFAEFYDNSSILFGGCGLLSKDGIKKPAYYAYSFLQHMHNFLVEKGSNYLVTTDGRDNYYMICHNFQNLNYKYYLHAEDEQDIEKLHQLYEDGSAWKLSFSLKKIKNGKYKVKGYSINDQHGSVQEEWKNLGFSSKLSKQEVNYLKRVCTPYIQIKEHVVDQCKLEFEVEMQPQEIQYMHISYLYEE